MQFQSAILCNLGSATTRAAEAISLSRAWAKRRQDQQNVHGTAVALIELAQLLLETGRASEALVEARRAERLALDYTLTDELMGARRLVALALLRQGRLDQAVTLLRQTAQLARSRPTARGILETHLDLGNALALGGRVAEALSAYDVAAGAVEKMAWRLEHDLDRARYRERWLDPFEGAVRLVLRQTFSTGRLAELVRWSQRLKGASLARAAGGGTGEAGSTTPLSLDEIWRRLRPREAVIDYLVVDSEVAAVVVARDTQAVVRLPTPADSIRQWIEDLRSPLVAMYGGRIDVARAHFSPAIAGKLYEALLAPLEPLLVGIRRLTIVPSGALHYVPFDALVLSGKEASGATRNGYRSRRYVVDRYEIAYLPSLQFLAGQGPPDRTVLKGERVVAFAFGVPGDTAELEAIRSAWPARRVATRVGSAASETVARGEVARYGIVHFATHAQARDDDPLSSHLLLAADSANDGYLHLSEVAARRVSARLVVLSACETLSGTLYNGEGLMGLARAFLAGGSRAVVATHWPVGSWAADLMAVFYRRLAAGDEPAAALRAAKLTLLENPATADPFFWAGFVLVSLE